VSQAEKPEFLEAQLGSADYESCLSIRREVFIGEQCVPQELEIDNEEESRHFLLNLGTQAVCTGRLRPLASKRLLKFERIATRAPFRGKGFARELMLGLQSVAARDYTDWTWSMGAQLSAVAFYEKLGWMRETDKIFLDAGIEHLTLVFPHSNKKP
jgi:predicted GNAT family N-acyltransferase